MLWRMRCRERKIRIPFTAGRSKLGERDWKEREREDGNVRMGGGCCGFLFDQEMRGTSDDDFSRNEIEDRE